jgi:hypothetical protein
MCRIVGALIEADESCRTLIINIKIANLENHAENQKNISE